MLNPPDTAYFQPLDAQQHRWSMTIFTEIFLTPVSRFIGAGLLGGKAMALVFTRGSRRSAGLTIAMRQSIAASNNHCVQTPSIQEETS